ncbi:hypothetical protein O181_122779 [Austropuccinia psidii MF-1]|uniref:Uncharacterized protein n=1 Tax=Austropuccinia psidii MF-1 TaxID=1389203 RepID=A0A9Q3KL85_9BASI|nr:hypothetical protein [Austropuccinia psidii MF-1]
MDLDKEEARPGPDLESFPQERHVWRIPALPPIPQCLYLAIEIYQSKYRNCYRAAKEEEWEIFPSVWQGAMNSVTTTKIDSPPWVLRQFQPGTKLGPISHTISFMANWYPLVPYGHSAISCHHWPPWPISISPSPRVYL